LPLGIAMLSVLLAGCSPTTPASPKTGSTEPSASTASGDVQNGRTLLIEKGCGACHSARGVPEARGSIGPALTGVASKPRIADTVPNTPENMKRWITNPSAIKPGTMMPPLGLTDKESDDLVAFLETLK
jgi:cytochrome c